jgi:hypothetical protein
MTSAPQPFGPPAPPPNPPAKVTNTLAIVSAVSGAIGWMGVPLVASVVAIFCGHLARKEIRNTGQDGDQLALIGLVLGYTHVVLFCVIGGFLVLLYGGIIAAAIAGGALQHGGH